MEQKQIPTAYQKLTTFMEQNTRAAEFVCYGITGIGLLVAVYRIRPFSKFKKLSDIPPRFLKQTELKGVVKRIDPSYGTLLMVDHKPLIPFPRFSREKYLPIKLSGINVTSQGISWLQTVVNGKEITFIPLANKKDYLQCIATFSEKDQERINISEELVKLGFGYVCNQEDYLLKDKLILPYYRSLIKAQKFAQFKRNGYWHFVIKPTFSWKIKIYLSEKLKSFLPKFLIKQFNI